MRPFRGRTIPDRRRPRVEVLQDLRFQRCQLGAEPVRMPCRDGPVSAFTVCTSTATAGPRSAKSEGARVSSVANAACAAFTDAAVAVASDAP